MGKIVYHYTNLKAFKDIIEGDSLFLSNIRKSNDWNELRHCTEEVKGLREFDKGKDGFWTATEEMATTIPELIDCYAICFSSKKDSLSQWERYSDKGKGVAIGFDVKKLENLVEELNANIQSDKFPSGYRKILMKKMEYKKTRNIVSVYEILKKLEKPQECLEKCVFTKHKGFSEEKEIRIALLLDKKRKEKIKNEGLEAWRIDEKEGYLLKEIKKTIVGVMLGPLCTDEDGTKVEELCEKNKCNCKIEWSEIPYIPKN